VIVCPREEAEDTPVAVGQVVAGKYRVERLLGRGGMGLVVAATDLTLERTVAMKVLLAEHARNPEAVARFLREGRAAVKLTSDHVARIFEVGNAAPAGPYMAMEYLDGADLAAELERSGPLHISRAVDYVQQACDAIAEAHGLGIVHRDLKPHNLFLARRPNGRAVVKVLDFGISKVVQADGALDLTTTGTTLGTPLYMAPEQMRSARDVDARTDVWALGVILYELITGTAPFRGRSVTEVAVLVTNEPPVPPRSLRPDLSEGLAGVILRCLEKDPAARYQTAVELSAALEPFCSYPERRVASADEVSRSGGARAMDVAGPVRSSIESAATVRADSAEAGLTPARAVRTDVSWGTTGGARLPRRRPLSVAVAVVGVVLVASSAAFILLRHPTPGPAEAPSAATLPAPAASAAPVAVSVPAAVAVPVVSAPAQTAVTPSASSAAPAATPPPARLPVRVAPPAMKASPPPQATIDPGSVR
jgi:serine/threonine-protein kinase